MTTAPETEAEHLAEELRERTFTWDDPVAIARAGADLSGAAEYFQLPRERTVIMGSRIEL